MAVSTNFVEINIDIPYNRILSRLGYRKSSSSMLSCQLQNFQTIMEEAAAFIHLRGAYSICSFTPTETGILLETGDRIDGKLPMLMARESEKALIMAATSGRKIMEEISSLQKTDMSKAVIYDATASEITDSGLDWIMHYVSTMMKRMGGQVSRKRFSPGYGDLELKNQKSLYRILELDKLGIDITASCILVPEKSVIAITGII
ncbi:MAG: hypothetical protein MJ215_01550 [Spirochaetia bacterium]|nr:hypothetical protein [Spirochaetia bacterium]